MRRRGKIFRIIISVMVTGIFVWKVCFFLKKGDLFKEYPPKDVRRFSFSSPESLNEWEEKIFAHGSTAYNVVNINEKFCVKAVSKSSASALYLKVCLLAEKSPCVSWDWKVEEFPFFTRKESLTDKENFDFAAQVYVIFYSRMFLKAKAIQYVWAKETPVRTMVWSPYTKNVKILVLESGTSGVWKREARNLKDDFYALFGEKLDKNVMAIAFMTDSDSTSTGASAYYDEIVLGYSDVKI